jgi:hypothetical protein
VVSNALTELKSEKKQKIRKNNNNNRGTSEAKTRGEAHIPFTTMLVSYVTSYNKQARSLCAHQERAEAKLNAKSENGKAVSCPCRGEAQDILPMRGMTKVTAAKASNNSSWNRQVETTFRTFTLVTWPAL